MEKELDRIAGMVGNTYLYKKNNYTITGFVPSAEKVVLKTDNGDLTLLTDGLAHQLGYFLEVEPEPAGLQVTQQTQMQGTLQELNTIMMDTIRKVQQDKEYVAQAGAVNKSVTNITNLMKAQLEFMKIASGK
jgi:hypothetical protein